MLEFPTRCSCSGSLCRSGGEREEREGKGELVESEVGKVREERQRCRIHLFSTIFCTDTNQVYRAQALFIGGLLSIVSLEVFAEPCDLGQGLREAINNSECEGAVFRANFKNCVTSLTRKGGRSRSSLE